MFTIASILIAIIIGAVVGLMNQQEQKPKARKRKKNFFIRWGERGGKYYW